MNFLFTNQKPFYNSLFFKWSVYLIAAFFYAYFAGLSAGDDGLRHIAFAAHKNIMHSWGDVFPHSLFFTNYDPWMVWDKFIAFLLLFFPYNNVHIAINITVFFTLFVLLDALLLKYSSFKRQPMLILLILAIVSNSLHSYVNIRPDLLSGLFIMSALLFSKRLGLLFFLTLCYSGSYYLFFLYTGSLGILFLVLREYKTVATLFTASLLGLGFHLYYGGEEFIKTITYLLTDQTLREGLSVGEGSPLFSFLKVFNYYVLVLFAWSVSFVIIYFKYDYFKKQHIALLLLIMSPLWLAQVRYYYLLRPLFFVYLAIESRVILQSLFSRKIQYFCYKIIHIIKSVQYKTAFIVPALLYTAFMLGFFLKDLDHAKRLAQKDFFKNRIFNNQTILINSLTSDIYYALYLNPTIKFVPSCSIGWFEKNEKMKKIYTKMMKPKGINELQLSELMKFVNAKYYFHILRNEQQILSFEKLEALHIEPLLVIDNKILFQRGSE